MNLKPCEYREGHDEYSEVHSFTVKKLLKNGACIDEAPLENRGLVSVA